MGIAQLVEHPIQNPGAILNAGSSPRCGKGFSPRVSFVRADPVGSRMHQHLCAR